MVQQNGPGADSIERGAAEDASGAPLTETEIENSRRAPSEPREDRTGDEIVQPDASGMAGGASGGSGGGSGLGGHPDAAQ